MWSSKSSCHSRTVFGEPHSRVAFEADHRVLGATLRRRAVEQDVQVVGHKTVDGDGTAVHRRRVREGVAHHRVDLVVRETALASVFAGGEGDAFLPDVVDVRQAVRAFSDGSHGGILREIDDYRNARRVGVPSVGTLIGRCHAIHARRTGRPPYPRPNAYTLRVPTIEIGCLRPLAPPTTLRVNPIEYRSCSPQGCSRDSFQSPQISIFRESSHRSCSSEACHRSILALQYTISSRGSKICILCGPLDLS